MTDTVMFSITLLGGIILSLLLILLIDWLGRREDRKSKPGPTT